MSAPSVERRWSGGRKRWKKSRIRAFVLPSDDVGNPSEEKLDLPEPAPAAARRSASASAPFIVEGSFANSPCLSQPAMASFKSETARSVFVGGIERIQSRTNATPASSASREPMCGMWPAPSVLMR